MRRREFVKLLGAAAASPTAWPLEAFPQEASRQRRIGVLMNFRSAEPEGDARVKAFAQALQKLGWTEGANVHTDIRWCGDDVALYRRYAEELVALTPDVILASASTSIEALQRVTRRVPIVFANVIDPVGAGFVNSLARPGGNTTGFTAFEYSISGKWVELLKEIAPHLTRAAVLRDPAIAAGIGQFAAIQATAASSRLELSVIDTRDAGEMEQALTAFAGEVNGGLIVTASTSTVTHRAIITSLATRHRLPSIYAFRFLVAEGGLVSYGPNSTDGDQHAAGYVDRILKGERPSELPVQAPTQYELVINLKTAKALGLAVPDKVLARADEVIE
jgi:putative tryptophan/tyrosine transport system substrate-binding protein